MEDVDKLIEAEPHKAIIPINATLESETFALAFAIDGYQRQLDKGLHPSLPKGIPSVLRSKVIESKDFSPEILRDVQDWLLANGKFDRERYDKPVAVARKEWKLVEPAYFQTLQSIKGLQIPSEIRGYITLYGPGGSFHPNRNFFYMRTDGDSENPKFIRANPAHTIGHEVLELTLHPFVNKLPYQIKERFINLIITKSPLGRLFPTYELNLPPAEDKSIDNKFSWDFLKGNLHEAIDRLIE